MYMVDLKLARKTMSQPQCRINRRDKRKLSLGFRIQIACSKAADRKAAYNWFISQGQPEWFAKQMSSSLTR